MTFAELKAELRLNLFPQGEAPELVIPHNKSFLSAVIDLQRKVECLQVNNTQIYNFCATMFQCGMTVIQAPRGKINKVSVFVRRDADCEEDAESDVNWCDEIEYHYVDHAKLTRLLDRRLRCACNTTLEGLLSLDSSLCYKMLGDAYPAPDDADYEDFDELPQGFHYPQDSTDSTKGRARQGVWSMEKGRIYLSPWIQSTEVVVVEWDGVKRSFDGADLVSDDPGFTRAVQLFVAWEHARDFEKNTVDYEIYEKEYREAVADLIVECDKESRGHARQPSKARMSQSTLLSDAVSVDSSGLTTTTSTTTSATASIYGGSVAPNGVQSADGPAVYIQDDGSGGFVQMWTKPDGSTGNTGWV